MFDNTIKSKCLWKKLITISVIMYPLLSIYGIAQVHLGMLILFVVLLVKTLFTTKIKMNWPKFYWLFFIYMMLTRILFSESITISSLFSLNLICFSLLLGFSLPYFDLDYGIKVYRLVILCCCSFFFAQEIMFYTLGYRTVGIIPWLPINIAIDWSTATYISIQKIATRSASFFLEPAHFAQFIIPFLTIELFKNKDNRKINFYVIITSIVMLLLRSGTGILLISIIWLIWLFYYLHHSPLYKKFLLFFVVIPIITFCTYYYLQTEIGKEIIFRKTEFSEVNSTASAYVRIIRGYDLFANFPNLNLYFGLNSPTNIKSFISRGGMYSLFQENDLLFSCIQSILIYGGFVGLSIYLIHFTHFFKGNYMVGKMVIVAFIGLSIISPIYLMGEMLLCYNFIYSFQKESLQNALINPSNL